MPEHSSMRVDRSTLRALARVIGKDICRNMDQRLRAVLLAWAELPEKQRVRYQLLAVSKPELEPTILDITKETTYDGRS